MASGEQQLATDYEQVKKQLSLYPNIRIIETEGDPPDRYDIEYNVKGYKIAEDGTASPANSHTIRITLPFGYPHFPPTVKPLTPIFHPDIDPDAIRIADFWQKKQSLAELVIHIGKMICGMIYQKEEPFNQKAFDWFEERQDWLPFDTLEPGEAEEDKPVGTEDPAGLPAAEQAPADELLNILDDDLSLAPEGEPSDDLDIDLFEDDDSEDMLINLFDDEEDDQDDALLFDFDFDEENTSETDEPREDDITGLGAGDENISLPLDDSSSESPGELGIEAEEVETRTSHEVEEETEAGIDLDFLSEELAASVETGKEQTPKSTKEESDEQPAPEAAPPQVPEESTPVETETPAAEKSEPVPDTSVEEESLAGLELEDESSDNAEQPSGSGKTRAIRPLIEQKKIFTAKKVLADITDPASVPDLEELEQEIADAITRAEDLYKKADKLEHAKEYEKAGLTLDLVANVAVDYPGLEFARNRLRESLLAKDSRQATASAEEEGEGKTAKKRKTKARTGFKLPYKIIALVLLLIGILAAATMVTIKDSDNIELAYSKFQKAQQLLTNKDYKKAKKSLDDSKAALDGILAFQKKEKEKLLQKINTITDSQSFKEGLQGRVLYDDKYVTVEMAKSIDQLNALTVDAETQQNSGNIDEALKIYAQAGQVAGQIGFEEQEETIRQTINSLQLKQVLGEARNAEEEHEWEQAADTYAKALELSNNLAAGADKNDIATRLATASFRAELREGQRAFTASEWQKTIEMLQRAQKILEDNPQIASDVEKTEVQKLLINSRLYHILSGAKNAFEKKEWELAVNQYKNAIYLLENNKRILGEKAVDSISKIDKTILMTEISREQNVNFTAVDNNDLQTSLASYRSIATLIEKSSFSEDDLLEKILENARTQITILEEEIKINRRVDWLTSNYEEIFRKMYPSARSSELSKPQVTFVKEEGDKLVFTMSCVEKRQGRSFRLELNYQYDQKNDKWAIYSGSL